MCKAVEYTDPLEKVKKTRATPEPESEHVRVDLKKLVERMNALSIDEFRARYIGPQALHLAPRGANVDYALQLKDASGLKEYELGSCFHLIEASSRPDYEASSWGWHPKRKRREMQEPDMKYLLLRCANSPYGPIEGFLSFMITHDSTPSVPVLYIYEIHLANSLRGLGLGTQLMKVAEDVAGSVGVEKVMLTCFLSNRDAHAFYHKRGYRIDQCSPRDRKTRRKVIKVAYEIMSKALWEEDEEG